MGRARDRADGKITGNVVPAANEQYSLGSSTARFNDGYFAASTVDIGGLAISKDSGGNAEFTDGSGTFKKIMASEIHLGTGTSKAIMKRQSDGSVGFATSDNSGSETAASVGSSTTVVANSANLPTSSSDGDLAFAVDTSRLYLSRNNAWYSVALVNTAPSVSGNQATYELATDGTATVVTMTGTDPEGDPITWTSSTSGLGSIATVSQGSGASTNVFTITPSTSESNAGTFSVSFQASDGVNTATATSSFTLVFSSPLTRGTQLLVKTSGINNRTNSVFDDSSSSNHTVTAYGDSFQSSHSPYSVPDGHWAYVFTGSNYLRATDCEALGSADFSIEFFMKGNNTSGYKTMFESRSSGSNGFGIGVNPSNTLYLYHTGFNYTSSVALPVNEWCHVALIGDGTANTVSYYQDGKYIGAWSIDYNFTSTQFTIGTDPDAGSDNYVGRLSNVRVSNTKRYTTDFKVPSEPFSTDSNTKVLTCQSVILKENSGNTRTWVKTGTLTIKPDAPSAFITPDKWKTSKGGSAYFDGNGDYLNVADHADFDLSGSWTFETWVYPTNLGSGFNPIFQVGADSSNGFVLDCSSGGSTPRFLYHAGSWVNFSSSATIQNDTWSHLSLSWDGSTYRLFVNGVVTGSASSSTAITNPTTVVQVGRSTTSGGAQRYFKGWISDTHFVKGTAKYTSAFTPPTSLVSNHSNTKLKLNFSQAGIFDSAAINDLRLYGDAKESTTQKKYATTSMAFDGTGDYIVTEDDLFKVGTADWQFEAWVRWTSGAGGIFHNAQASIGSGNQTNSGTFGLGVSSSNKWIIYHNGQTEINSTVSADTWYHVVYLRRNSVRKVYVNGTEILSAADTNDYSATDTFNLGGWYSTGFLFNGYIEDARFLTGHTIYPNERPQAALTAITNTKLLTARSASIADASTSNHTLTNTGTVAASTWTPSESAVTHSYYFNGSSQYLATPSSSDFSFGTGDYSIEFWLYAPSANAANATGNVLDFRNGSSGFNFYLTNGRALYYGNEQGGNGVGNITINYNQWYHVSANRQSGVLTYCVDGVVVATGSNTNNIGTTGGRIGNRWSGTNQYFKGYLSDLRIIKGSGNGFGPSFTVPSAAL